VTRGARVALALCMVAGCSDLNELADGVISLEVRPPNPPIIEFGDTASFAARALDANGDSVDADIRWLTPDTTLTIVDTAAGLVAGKYPAVTGRVQAQLGTLQSGFTTLTVEARADTIIVPDAVEDSVQADEPSSNPLVARLESFDPAGPLAGRSLIYEIVAPTFGDPATRTVELPNGALADTVQTAGDGTPSTPVVVRRIAGVTPPASVTVQVRGVQRRGTPVPGSGQAFTVLFF
jgi:hypothetical protein